MIIFKHNVKSASGKIYEYYVVDFGRNGNEKARARKHFKTKGEALEFVKMMKKRKTKYGDSFNDLTSTQHSIAVDVFRMLSDASIPDTQLLSIVSSFIALNSKIREHITLSEAKERYEGTFSAAQKLHKKLASHYICALVEFLKDDVKISSISEEDMTLFFNNLQDKYSTKTYNNMLSYLKTFFNWCEANHLISGNPIVLQKKKIEYHDPEFVKQEILSRALHAIDEDNEMRQDDKRKMINAFVLSFFCGIRTSEIYRLTPDAVHPEDEHPYVRISTTKGAAKGIKGRTVDLEANAVAWLKKYPLTEQLNERNMADVRKRASLGVLKDYPSVMNHNIGRHSYITYHVAKHRDCARTEAYVGTSASMRVRHYQGLATTADGIAYFDIFPAS